MAERRRSAATARSSRTASSVGAIGLFRIDENAKLTRAENSGVIPDRPATPALDFSNVGVLQGFVESGNVNPVMEMTRLIEVHRAFDALTNSMDTADTHAENRHPRTQPNGL